MVRGYVPWSSAFIGPAGGYMWTRMAPSFDDVRMHAKIETHTGGGRRVEEPWSTSWAFARAASWIQRALASLADPGTSHAAQGETSLAE